MFACSFVFVFNGLSLSDSNFFFFYLDPLHSCFPLEVHTFTKCIEASHWEAAKDISVPRTWNCILLSGPVKHHNKHTVEKVNCLVVVIACGPCTCCTKDVLTVLYTLRFICGTLTADGVL